jgi:hypothetical protein
LPPQLKIEEGQKTSERFPAWRINAVSSDVLDVANVDPEPAELLVALEA